MSYRPLAPGRGGVLALRRGARDEPDSQRSFTETCGSALGLTLQRSRIVGAGGFLGTTVFKKRSLGNSCARLQVRAVRKRAWSGNKRTAALEENACRTGSCSPSCCASPPPSRPATPRRRRPLSLAAAKTQLDGYWSRQIENLRRPAAQALSDRLASNALGFPHDSLDKPLPMEGKNTPRNLRMETQHPTKVLLVRVGEFYEAWGIDATLLVEHCGRTPWANKVRAGCPWRNLQQTLDGLTRNGLTVAVYEERFCADPRRRERKVLSTSGSTGASTYVQNQALSRNDLEWRCEGPQFVASS